MLVQVTCQQARPGARPSAMAQPRTHAPGCVRKAGEWVSGCRVVWVRLREGCLAPHKAGARAEVHEHGGEAGGLRAHQQRVVVRAVLLPRQVPQHLRTVHARHEAVACCGPASSDRAHACCCEAPNTVSRSQEAASREAERRAAVRQWCCMRLRIASFGGCCDGQHPSVIFAGLGRHASM